MMKKRRRSTIYRVSGLGFLLVLMNWINLIWISKCSKLVFKALSSNIIKAVTLEKSQLSQISYKFKLNRIWKYKQQKQI